MQQSSNAKTDRTPEIEPPIEPAAAWRIRNLRVIEHGRLDVTFVDGLEGEVDLRPFLASSRVEGTPFERLRDASFFTEVQLSLGAPQWPNGADLAPDAIYDSIREQGFWCPE